MKQVHAFARQNGLRAAVFLLLAFALGAHAGSVRTRDGTSVDGQLHFSSTGLLIVKPLEGEPVSIELTNVAVARFAPGAFLSSGSILPNGWIAQDLGDARGFARLDNDAFTLRVEGQSTNATACHFIHRPMPSEGEIIARVEQLSGSTAFAGVMIRAASSSLFASLSCGHDGQLWFHRREGEDRKETRLSAVASVAAPVWLRLQKRDRLVLASWSSDGRTWQAVASEPLKISYEKTWREHEGDLSLLRASFGIFAASRGKETVGTARVTQVSMSLHGLLGEYFSDPQFTIRTLARVDPQIRFNWGTGSPDPSLDKDDFAVRWTGALIPPKSGGYRFYFDADDRARLWIAGREIEQVGLKKFEQQVPPRPVMLVAGKPVDFKMEFNESDGPASVKLGWAYQQQQPPEVIAMTNFLYSFAATNSPEKVMASRATNDAPAIRGVMLRDGSFVAGGVTFADESAVKLSFAGRKDVPVLNSRVARIFLRPPRQPLRFEIASGRTGLFLKSGDFFECDFRRIEHGSVQTSSVLFGLRRFGIESGDAVALVLNDCTPAGAFEVSLLNGSLLRAVKISATSDALTLETPLLGRLSIPTSDLYELKTVQTPARTIATPP